MKNCKSYCPINQALEVFGDKWTLLIIRDIMFDGKRYFREMLNSDEKIASNILTDRLNKLEQFGILIKTKDAHHKQKNVYSLTEKGIDLMPVMLNIANWSAHHRDVTEEGKAKVKNYVAGGQELQDKLQSVLKDELKLVLKNR
jgi:DNA-binding HxlR family transcriptional regulator